MVGITGLPSPIRAAHRRVRLNVHQAVDTVLMSLVSFLPWGPSGTGVGRRLKASDRARPVTQFYSVCDMGEFSGFSVQGFSPWSNDGMMSGGTPTEFTSPGLRIWPSSGDARPAHWWVCHRSAVQPGFLLAAPCLGSLVRYAPRALAVLVGLPGQLVVVLSDLVGVDPDVVL